MTGRTTSSATSIIFSTSRPVRIPSRSATAAKHSRRVAGARPEGPRRAVDLHRARPGRQDAVGDRQAEVLVAVEADLRVATELGDERADVVLGHVLQDHGPGRMKCHVHALAAGIGHDPLWRASTSGRWEWAIIRKPTVSRPSSPGETEVLDGDVGLGAVGGDPDDGDAEVGAGLDVDLRAEAREDERGDAVVVAVSTATFMRVRSSVFEKP